MICKKCGIEADLFYDVGRGNKELFICPTCYEHDKAMWRMKTRTRIRYIIVFGILGVIVAAVLRRLL